jgi:lysophospholipase L1-like esterase
VRARAGLLAVGLLIGLGLAEMLVRVFVSRPGSELARLHVLRPDRPWLYGMRPNTVVEGTNGIRYEINADGFRGPRATRPKAAHALRIAVLGDSVTFGYGVNEPETYPSLLAARLAGALPHRAVEVLNFGVNGYNPYTEAALFADLGPTYAPDVVLVQFCINDLNDPTMHFDASTTVALGLLPDAAFPDPRTRNPAAVRRRFDCHGVRLCQLLSAAWHPVAPTDAAALGAGLVPHDAPSEVDLAWLTARYAEIGQTAAAIGARPVLVVFPYSTQLAPDAPSAIETTLARLAADLGWTVIDLLPAYRAAARDGALFADLWHPTVAGQRVAAAAIADALLGDGVLGAPAR